MPKLNVTENGSDRSLLIETKRVAVLSLVVLFRNFTTPIHVLFYIGILYPILTGERPRLLLPWLYLQMIKNIITDVICTAAGVLLCWIRHSRGLMALEFFVVQIISMMPSIYLWRWVRSYYFDLYYAELDGDFSFPPIKESNGMTLAQRRRATKSLDSTTPLISSPDNRSRINSCLTYDEFFGPTNWEGDSDNQLSKSLTTVLTVESQESDDVEEDDNSLEIIDDRNLTPAEKTRKILGLTREEVDAVAIQLHKKTSTKDFEDIERDSNLDFFVDADVQSSIFSLTDNELGTVESRSVGIQVCLTDRSKSNASNGVSMKCKCCEETECSKEEDTDSCEERTESIENNEDPLKDRNPLNCCDQNRERHEKHHEIEEGNEETDANNDNVGALSIERNDSRSASTYHHKNDLYSGSCLRAVVERDGIAWENLKEINFVSVINKALCCEMKPFKLQRESPNSERNLNQSSKHLLDEGEEGTDFQSEQNQKEIIPEREDGTKSIHRFQESSNTDPVGFSGPTSASFGVESDILALNTSHVFPKIPNSETQSFDSTCIVPNKHSIRPNDDTEINSYFESSFQRHSKMFDDTTAELELLPELQCNLKVHSSVSYRVIHGANEDSRSYQTDKNSVEENTDGSSYSFGFHRSRSSSPQYQWSNYYGLDSNRGNFSGNKIDIVRDIAQSTKSRDSEIQQTISSPEKFVSSSFQAQSLLKESDEINRASQTSSTSMFKTLSKADGISNSTNVGEDLKLNSGGITQTEEQGDSTTTFIVVEEFVSEKKSSDSKNGRREGSKERKSLASLSRISRSSKNRETTEEREAKEMQALRSYNEKTLFKYKREMDARNREENDPDKFQDSLGKGKQSLAGIYGNNFNHASVSELEKPEKELILNIENAYARFTRSKPVDSVNSQTLHGSFAAKEFFDIYNNGNNTLGKDSRKIEIGDQGGMRKQHSKYRKLYKGVTNDQSEVTSKSSKRIEGSQKGQNLDRIIAKENIRSQNVEVYFLERRIDDKPSTSKNFPIKTIKSFSRKKFADGISTVSSENLTSELDTQSPMIEVLNNSEEIPFRIEESEHYRQLRKKNLPKNVREVVKNIDWSFQRPTFIGICDRTKEKCPNNVFTGIVSTDVIPERQDIIHKTTENILQSIFANSENSERGFRLGESANEFYPIFNTVAIAMEEIVRAASLRGYNDEFISQPAIEIEIPEIVDGNLYGQTDLPSEPRRESPFGFFRRSILPEDIKAAKKRSGNDESLSITTFTAPDLRQKKHESVKRETDPLNHERATSIGDEKASPLLNKLISSTEPESAEINMPVNIGAEDLTEKAEQTSGDVGSSDIKDLEDYYSFFFKALATSNKSPFSSRSHHPENFLRIGQKPNRISSEQVRLAIQNVILENPREKITNIEELQLQFEVSSYRGILDHFNAGGKEMRSIVYEFFDHFPSCEGLPRNFRGSEFMAELQTRNNLYAIETKVGEIIKATEYREVSGETVSASSRNSSLEQNDRPEGAMTQTGTSCTINSGNMTSNTLTGSRADLWRKQDREKEENNLSCRGAVKIDTIPQIRDSSSENIDKPREEDQRLLSNILEPDSVSLTHSEMLNRTNFKREVISSALVKGTNGSKGSSDGMKGSQVEVVAPKNEDEGIKLDPNDRKPNELKTCDFVNVESEAEVPELWITDDDDEEIASQRSVVCPIKKIFVLDDDGTALDLVPRDIETEENAVKKMRSIFQQFVSEDQSRREEKSEKHETSLEKTSEISSLKNLQFPVNEELRNVQNLVENVTNYVTITLGSPTQSMLPSNEAIESEIRREEMNSGCRNETSDNLEDVPEMQRKNGAQSTCSDDSQVGEVSAPKTKSSIKNSKLSASSRNEMDRFSSWDKVVPLSTKRLIAKSNRKSKRKKTVAPREPSRRVVKVVKMIEEKSVDFFSARSVPQRGRGLSSGYLMDSDSDGNFTVSRPPTPISIQSDTSQTFSCNNEKPDVFRNPLEDSKIFPMSGTSHSRTTDRPIETCWSSSSADAIKDRFLSMKNRNSTDNLIRKTSESLELSSSPLSGEVEVSFTAESADLRSNDDDKTPQNASCDRKSMAFGAESLSTESDLEYMKSVDAAGIENKLKDVVQQILNHRFTGSNSSTKGPRIGSRNASLASISDAGRIKSPTNLEPTNCNPEDYAEEPREMKSDRHKRIQEPFSKDDDISSGQPNVHFKGSDSTSKNSDAVSFEVSPRKSRINVKHVAIGTEYDVEAFKELLAISERIHSGKHGTMAGKASKNCEIEEFENGNNVHDDSLITCEDEKEVVKSNSEERLQSASNPSVHSLNGIHLKNASNSSQLDSSLDIIVSKNSSAMDIMPIKNISNLVLSNVRSAEKLVAPELAVCSYDSFSSTFSQTKIKVFELSCQERSISNHTYFEEFPEQVVSGSDYQFSSDSIKFKAHEKSSKTEMSFINLRENSNHVIPAAPGNTKSDDDKPKNDSTLKKTGIPRPVRGSKERK